MSNKGFDLPTLRESFLMQDGAIPRNLELAHEHFVLLDEALSIGLDIIARINDPEPIKSRCSKPVDAHRAETITINLLTTAIYTVVSSARLALAGNHVDSLTLLRSAFEATYFAEYFRHYPEEALKWDSSGQMADPSERRKFIEHHFRMIRSRLEARDDPDRSRTRFYRELSSYGPHPTPATVAARMSQDHAATGIANAGYVSVGKQEATMLCAAHALQVLMYAVSEFLELCGSCAVLSHASERYAALEERWQDLRKKTPTELSLLR